MSYKTPNIFTYKADGQLGLDAQYKLVKFGSADNKVALCGADEKAIGTIHTKPSNIDGEELEICSQNGGGQVVVAAAIARGEYFKSDANGKAVVAADRSEAIGQIDESATAANQVVACVIF